MSPPIKSTKEPLYITFLSGGLGSCTAEVVTLPFDMAKVRLQIQQNGPKTYNNMVDCIVKVARHEGLNAQYKGFAPAQLRQAIYSSIKMGIYEPTRALFSRGKPIEKVNFLERILAGGTAGAVGIQVANPADLQKIRMQADKAGTRYKHGQLRSFVDTVRAEGVFGLWKGVIPGMQRAYIVNAAELATYDQAKTLLVQYVQCDPTNVATHLISSATAGVVAAVSSQPVDLIKNRLMNQSALPDGTLQYTGMTQCGIDIVRKEGFLSLFKGVGANSCRIGQWCVVMFTTFEQLRMAFNKLHTRYVKSI